MRAFADDVATAPMLSNSQGIHKKLLQELTEEIWNARSKNSSVRRTCGKYPV